VCCTSCHAAQAAMLHTLPCKLSHYCNVVLHTRATHTPATAHTACPAPIPIPHPVLRPQPTQTIMCMCGGGGTGTHNTCPICRTELPAEEAAPEKQSTEADSETHSLSSSVWPHTHAWQCSVACTLLVARTHSASTLDAHTILLAPSCTMEHLCAPKWLLVLCASSMLMRAVFGLWFW
jgi:hypothetical protein